MSENVVFIDKKNYPQSNLEYALAYAKIGFFVFPVWGATEGKCNCRRICKSPGKHPVESLVPRGQDNATTDYDTIKRWWTIMPNAGIAVFLQPSGLMALDCDPRSGGIESFDEMEFKHGKIISDVMQITQSGGWHMIFKLSKDANITLPGKFGAGLDCKRQGYIILPPSKGVIGKYEFEASSDPLEGCIPSPMPDFFCDYSHSKITTDINVAVGSRAVTKQQIEELREALTHIPADDRDMWVKVGMALHSTGQEGFALWDNWSKSSAKYNPVDQIRVWRSFKSGSGLNYESVFFLASEHGFINNYAPPLPDPVPLEAVKIAAPAPKTTTPPHLLHPPGILGIITKWINATSRKSQPQFDVQAAIAFCSVVMGRRYCTDQNNWPSLYLLNIGKSASGKEHAKWAVEELLEACKLPNLIGPSGYTSSSGVLSTLNHQPVHLAVIDEFGKVLEAASVKGNVMARGALTALMESWGRCDGVMRPVGCSTLGMSAQDAKKLVERTVHNPAITLMGMATPDTFFESIGSASARDGFLNRFILVESDIGRQAGRPSKRSDVPQSIIDWTNKTALVEGLIDPAGNPNLKMTPRVIPIRDDAQGLFDAFEAENIAHMDAHDETGLSEMFGRACEQSMRLALIVSIADDCESINASHAAWAIDYIRHYAIRAVKRIASSVSDSSFQALYKQVLTIIKDGSGVTERDLNRKSRLFAKEDQRGKKNVLGTLAFDGEIVRAESTGANGKKSMKWFPAV